MVESARSLFARCYQNGISEISEPCYLLHFRADKKWVLSLARRFSFVGVISNFNESHFGAFEIPFVNPGESR
jgi:hypothetical protein